MKEFTQGDSVHYIPFEGCDKSQYENGIVKYRAEDEPNYYFVVFSWSDEPGNFMNYTGQKTHVSQLEKGWV